MYTLYHLTFLCLVYFLPLLTLILTYSRVISIIKRFSSIIFEGSSVGTFFRRENSIKEEKPETDCPTRSKPNMKEHSTYAFIATFLVSFLQCVRVHPCPLHRNLSGRKRCRGKLSFLMTSCGLTKKSTSETKVNNKPCLNRTLNA